MRPSTSSLLQKLKIGGFYNDKKSENEKSEQASNSSYKRNKQNFDIELNKNISATNRNIVNAEQELYKNYGSLNNDSDLNKLTQKMAFSRTNFSNTNENFYGTKKSNNTKNVISNKNKEKITSVKKDKDHDIDSSYTSSLSSLESNLNFFDKKKSEIQTFRKNSKSNNQLDTYKQDKKSVSSFKKVEKEQNDFDGKQKFFIFYYFSLKNQ